MKTHRKLVLLLVALCLLLGMSGIAFAASYTGDTVVPGLSDIQSDDSLTLPDNTVWATLTASWGVRVSFVDWDQTVLKTELVPVSEETPGSSSAPEDPTREGYIFDGWERYDNNAGPATLNDDGTVTGVNGPGPIVFIAMYSKMTTRPPKPPAEPKIGNLTVSKTVSGNAADSTKAFSFTATLGDTTINGTYGGMTFTNGVATFTLKGGERKTATGLPSGTGYTVTEADYSADGYVTNKSGDTGVIRKGKTTTAAFTNTKNIITPPMPPVVPETGSLTVSKVLSGNAADSIREFDFTVILGDKTINGTYGFMRFVNGVANFALKGGESKIATGLPSGTSYTVTEADYSADGYVTTRTGDEGTIVENDVLTAKFTNTKNSEIPPVPKTVTVSGSKTWDDVDNRDGLRPSSITIKLLKNGKVADSKVVSEANNWSWSFTNLPENEDGQRIIYSIRENAVESYSAEYDGYNVTNHYTPGKVSVTVTKIWNDSEDLDGIRPDSVIVKLFADKEDTGKTLVLNSSGKWKGTFSDLDEYKEGKKITYTIEEERVTGYDSVITGDATVGYVITNSHTPKETPDKPDVPKDNPKKPDNPEYYDNPKTGDESNLFLWLALWLVSGGALAGIAIHWRKRKKAE